VFVNGLSAGGAMTAVMLATYPDVFAGGAIIAGLPYGCATNVQEALDCMFQNRSRPASEWGDLVRVASPHRGPWPKLSVWHGSADTTVVPSNADEIIKQWTDVHGVTAQAPHADMVDGYPRKVWRDASGNEVIESFTIASMAHGTPLATSGGDGYGAAGPFLLEAGISSTYHIAKFWGLTGASATRSIGDAAIVSPSGVVEFVSRASVPRDDEATSPPRPRPAFEGHDAGPAPLDRRSPIDIGAVIDRALKAAGLR
jgi:feruloyl esterase